MSDFTLIGKNIGQYQIQEQIGQGGMATVYRAYQPSINRHVAIKILPSQYAQDPNFVKRFEQEAKAIAALEHPHILPVYDFGTQDGLTYMVMRYVKGGTLSNHMGQERLSNERIVRLIGDMARALDYAHKQGVVHRDIKPSNILIDKNGEALLTDFGIAKLMEGSGATQLTGAGSVLGTPAYMSPEQARAASVDGRSDVYSLGVVLYELLTGQQPYQAETPVAVVLKHVSEPLTPPRVINTNVPEPLERVVMKAMAKEPGQRYHTAGEMEQALQQALKEIESGARTVSVPASSTGQTQVVTGPVPTPAKTGNPLGIWLIGGSVAVALLCLLGGGILFFSVMSSSGSSTGTPVTERSTSVNIGIEKTSTPTPVPTEPTASPTVESAPTTESVIETIALIPGLDGEILFEEDFTSNLNDWFTGEESDEYGQTNAEFIDGHYRLTQEAAQGVFIWNNLADTDFDNFVLSVEADPLEQEETSTAFAYGLTFREEVNNGDLYVFEIDTEGNYSVSLRNEGEWETLVNSTRLSAIRPTGPNLLTVKAVGPALTFFVNGQEATTIENDTLEQGAIGVALDLYNEGDKATVDFDNLIIRQVSAEELAALGNDSGSIIFEDTFDSDARGWSTGEFEDDYGQNEITIEDGRYTLSVTSKPDKLPYVEKLLPNRKFSDFILSVDVTPHDSEPHYSYGVAFREDGNGNVYVFEVGNDGLYAVLLYDNEWKRLKDWSSTQAIKPGETNNLTIVAIGSSLSFYLNEVELTRLEDDTLAEGRVGLVIDMAEGAKSATVDFDNLVIRKP